MIPQRYMYNVQFKTDMRLLVSLCVTLNIFIISLCVTLTDTLKTDNPKHDQRGKINALKVKCKHSTQSQAIITKSALQILQNSICA